ncbi:hypothetical protein ACFWXH_24780 [Mesorhizobium sp. NPDC059054]|uniref:hypothetical protein n=1 Tax=Mesorhizobium sp. NPDC059054 TaxID=3346711 RepID=UPI0036B0BC5F
MPDRWRCRLRWRNDLSVYLAVDLLLLLELLALKLIAQRLKVGLADGIGARLHLSQLHFTYGKSRGARHGENRAEKNRNDEVARHHSSLRFMRGL